MENGGAEEKSPCADERRLALRSVLVIAAVLIPAATATALLATHELAGLYESMRFGNLPGSTELFLALYPWGLVTVGAVALLFISFAALRGRSRAALVAACAVLILTGLFFLLAIAAAFLPLLKADYGWTEAADPTPSPTSTPLPEVQGLTFEKGKRADAEALLAKLRQTVPEGWGVTLYWDQEDTFFSGYDWLAEEWRNWLPGQDGRRIEVRRKKYVEFWMDASGPDPNDHSMRKEIAYPRFTLTLGERRKAEEIKRRLAKLNSQIQLLEIELKPSFYRRNADGYVQHTVPADDRSRRALQEYGRLWAIKRWLPQWTERSLSIGFRSTIWLGILPEASQQEYRAVKRAVLNELEPLPDWDLIPAEED